MVSGNIMYIYPKKKTWKELEAEARKLEIPKSYNYRKPDVEDLLKVNDSIDVKFTPLLGYKKIF